MLRRCLVPVLCAALLNLGFAAPARAGLIATLPAVESASRASDLATVHAALAREQVRVQMLALGVEPAQVEPRLAALTDGELRTLAGQISEAPAGGDALAVVGIVFIVLLILEAVGVIDVFKKFP
jgi:hypothetical protein